MPSNPPQLIIGFSAAELVRWPEILGMIAASRSTIKRWVGQGKFPKPIEWPFSGEWVWQRADIAAFAETLRQASA